MKVNQKELESVSNMEPFKRYQYLIKRIADSEKIYTLQSDDGDWASSTVKNHNLFPIWSASEFASNAAIDAWSSFIVVEEDIYNFMEATLHEIESDGFLLNVFPVGDTTGFVVKPDEFTRDLREELKNYE